MAPPIYVKGGQWTNVEDQILKAAVSKYGLTQWARVASLLPKKTAKQAKARWNEYLNPTINRSLWTKEEDEKLLGLAKLLPNQWRSIAPVLGRTPTQCVERYQELLERVLKGDEEEDDELKLSGPGIETLPALGNAQESLPSRPDLEDMDEDEQEMLSEAKARLGNTQGKKAKRKDRERMLAESKRISLLQKRREMKAGGINVSLELKNKKRRKEFDYNADIPHEHQPPPGLFDTSAEDERNEQERLSFQQQVGHKGMGPPEEKKRKKDDQSQEKQLKKLKKEILDAARLFADAAEQDIKRRKLDLPAPGTTEEQQARIDELIKEKTRQILNYEQPQKASRKVSARELGQFIRSFYADLPPPKIHTRQPLVSKIEQTEPEPELPKPAEEKKFQTQVWQRKLAFLSPNSLKEIDTEKLLPLEKAIVAQFQALVQSDFSESLGYGATAGGPEWKYYEKVYAAMKEEKPKKEHPLEPFSLPKSTLAVNECISLMHALDRSAGENDELWAAAVQEYYPADELYNTIGQLGFELAHTDEQLASTEAIASKDAAAVEKRSERLHGLVDRVRSCI